jgi:Transposase DDE domain group 1
MIRAFRQIGGLRALEDAAGIYADLMKHVRKVGSVTHQPFGFHKFAVRVSRWNPIASRQAGKLVAAVGEECVGTDEQGIGARPVADKLSCVFPEWRDPSRIVDSLADMIRARIFAIACGYEDGNDLDRLRNDPAFKLACGRLPDTDRDLCSQPTLSRLENAPCLREAIRLSYALVEAT